MKKEYLLSFLFLTIPFPLYIKSGERYIGTVTTFIILISFIYFILKYKKWYGNTKIDQSIQILSFSTLVPFIISFFMIPVEAKGSGLRYLTGTICSVLFFSIVYSRIQCIEDVIKIMKILQYSIWIYASIIVIGVLFQQFEQVVNYWTYYNIGEGLFVRQGFGLIRAKGILGDYELSAELLCIGIILSLGILLLEKRKIKKIIISCFLLLNTWALMFTGTRGGIVSLIFGLLVFFILGIHRKLISKTSVTLTIVVIGLIGVLGIAFIQDSILFPFILRLFDSKFNGFVPDTRVDVWDIYTQEINQRLWFGHGLFQPQIIGIIYDPHSIWLHILFACGIFGFAVFLFYLGALFIRLKYAYKINVSDTKHAIIVVTLITISLVFLLDQTKITYMRNENYRYFIWTLFSLFASMYKIYNNPQIIK